MRLQLGLGSHTGISLLERISKLYHKLWTVRLNRVLLQKEKLRPISLREITPLVD